MPLRRQRLIKWRERAAIDIDWFANSAVYATNSAQHLFAREALTKPKILSTRPLFPAARAILDQHCEVDYWTRPERILRHELLKGVADKEGLVCLLTEK